jgi:hypothetical protein
MRCGKGVERLYEARQKPWHYAGGDLIRERTDTPGGARDTKKKMCFIFLSTAYPLLDALVFM